MNTYYKKWYKKNKVRVKIWNKLYRVTHKEEIRKIHKKWRDKNRKHVRKMMRKIRASYYKRHKKRLLEKQNKFRSSQNQLLKNKLLQILGKNGCERCQYREFTCSLDIHHLDPSQSVNKEATKGSFYRLNKLILQAKKSPEKLKVLCANCHRALSCGRIENQ